jgi:hypothetical protein
VLPAKTPTRESVRQYRCPRCGAGPTVMCKRERREGWAVRTEANHAERVKLAQAYLGEALQLW